MLTKVSPQNISVRCGESEAKVAFAVRDGSPAFYLFFMQWHSGQWLLFDVRDLGVDADQWLAIRCSKHWYEILHKVAEIVSAKYLDILSSPL